MAAKQLVLFASDALKLSSLLLRRVLLAKPSTLAGYREKARQLLLDQSRPSPPSSSVNVAAVKMLALGQHWNLVRYYGLREYANRHWKSNSFPSSQKQAITSNEKNVARVAFMITSEQRNRLTNKLGYSAQDIRTFKPVEALLLLEHGVKKEISEVSEYDFRAKLNKLMEENDRLSKSETSANQNIKEADESKTNIHQSVERQQLPPEQESKTNIQQSVSPEEAQKIHAKPDVAMALLSAGRNADNQAEGGVVEYPKIHDQSDHTGIDPDTSKTEFPRSFIGDGPRDSESTEPDSPAALLSQLADGQRDDESGNAVKCWYEVIERVPAGNSESLPGSGEDDGGRAIALFSTEEEALEFVRIKRSARGHRKDGDNEGEGGRDGRFFIRRRRNA